ncbi:MAG: universal stress protein [Sphingobacteriales bacterium]|nr:MAG: universal stress protein [Sphingobacteriales bacterium]
MANKQTILLLTDFSTLANRAADIALELAVNNKKDLLIYNSIIYIEDLVTSGERNSSPEEIKKKTDKSEAGLTQIVSRLKLKLNADEQSLPTITAKSGMGGPMETILNLVAQNDVWMVVMGNHDDQQMANQYFDTNVPFVMSNCGCPLLLVP